MFFTHRWNRLDGNAGHNTETSHGGTFDNIDRVILMGNLSQIANWGSDARHQTLEHFA
jgi:hypothetical protein